MTTATAPVSREILEARWEAVAFPPVEVDMSGGETCMVPGNSPHWTRFEKHLRQWGAILVGGDVHEGEMYALDNLTGTINGTIKDMMVEWAAETLAARAAKGRAS